MPNPVLTNRIFITAKLESTYNTDPTPSTSADAIVVNNPSWAHEGLRMNERNVVSITGAAQQHVFGDTLKTVTFDVELKGSGTAGTAPDWGVLLQACGFAVTNVPATSDTYAPSSTFADQKSLTIWMYIDAQVHKITGCRGSVSFNLETGAIPMASFTFTGHSSVPTALAFPTSVTVDSTLPVTVKGNSFTIDSFGSVINSLTFDIANQVITPPDMGETDGFGEVYIAKRDLNGSFDPQIVLESEEAYMANFLAGANGALTTGAIGSTGGNIITITMPAVYYRDVALGDRDGVATYELPFGAVESSGDDEISIAIT